MKLSIYVNLRSIGWVVTSGVTVIAKGIKRVNVDFDSYYEFIAGLPVSKRINRRLKRQARKNNWRRKSRRENLRKYLIKLGWANRLDANRYNHLQLRVEALDRKLTEDELGIVFMSLQRKRGYKSMRGVNDNDASDYLAEIRKNEEALLSYRSIAEYLLALPSTKNVIFTRESYEAEFDKICQTQGIDDAKLRSLIYFQRPLSRGKIARCRIFNQRRVCHNSHPDYQEFRVWRDVNNIVICDNRFEEVEILQEQRNQWAEWLMSGRNLSKAKCCKDLGIKSSAGYTWYSGKQLMGNIVVSAIGHVDHDKLFAIWHDLFSATDDTKLALLIARKYSEMDADKLIDIDFGSAGWGEYSHKAIMQLLPVLKSGKKLKEAILGVFGVVDMGADLSLRNLVVEQHYDSYCSLVEALRNKFNIDESSVEISHLLKAGNKSRKQIAKTERMAKKNATGYSDYQNHLLRLHEEFNGQSPYEPGKIISRDELFTKYNVDHIVPKSKLFEHGPVNQCLCRKDLNTQKSSLTGIEFARLLGIEAEYLAFVDASSVSEKKKRFLLMESSAIPTDYIASDDYITRCFSTKVDYVMPNKIINKYYRDWVLDAFPDNDVRNSLMKAGVMANFDRETIEYFNNLNSLPSTSIGRYDLKQEVFVTSDVVPYLPRIKYYRKTKHGFIPRHQLHDESILGRRVEKHRNAKGQIVESEYFKIRKPLSSLTPPMVNKIMDPVLSKLVKERFDDREHADVIAELGDNPIFYNGRPVKSVSIRVNASDLIRLNRGYCYSSMNHRVDLKNKTVVKLYDYINDLNKGIHYSNNNVLKKHDVVEMDGKYYFVVGASEAMILRSVYELNAVGIRLSAEMKSKLRLVRVNQLGRLIYQ